MLVELVATGLAAETIEQKLKAEVTEGQAEERLAYLLPHSKEVEAQSGPSLSPHRLPPLSPCYTHEIVHGQWHVFQDLHNELLSI